MDQFISSGEAKWYRMNGLVMLLPHGSEGQGPEHSSARLERFLQLCAQNNIQVCYPTTPAQFFHMLRRQLCRKFRKPLIVMTPKSLLRAPEMISKKSDFLNGSFQYLIVDAPEKTTSQKIDRVLLCSGKVYWDLKKRLKETKKEDGCIIIRLEQLYPLDMTAIKTIHQKWGHLPWTWVQEETKNMGAWSFIRLTFLDHGINLNYVGRNAAASPATGSASRHLQEQEKLLEEALGSMNHGRNS
jgi:2-oxoglutarate dehydrogenase E1 component